MTTIRKSYRFKIYRSNRNKYLRDRINISGIIYNHCIALHKRYYRIFKKSLNSAKLQKHLAKIKKFNKYRFWQKVPAQSIQDIAQKIDKGYKLFFLNQKKKIKSSPPTFKKVRKYKSFTMKTANWELMDNVVRICDKTFKFSKSREIKGVIKTVTVKRNSLGDLYLYFSVIENKPESTFTSGKSVGLDFGLTTFLKTSDGHEESSPEFFKQGRNIIALNSKKVSGKVKGSNNRAKAVRILAMSHIKIANKRRDYFFKLAKNLCEQNDYIFIEDLNLKGMQKVWGRKISDLAFAEFVGILKSQGQKYDCVVEKIDRYFPSSKMCSACGVINEGLTLKDRFWDCVCGIVHDRDLNAAKNVLRVGASTHGLDIVRPEEALAKVV
jgi:putative transposase